eukprot:gnl/TRDRNA2_/TRDRNA2_82422_c1_seq1.p1 gnl/TRDRNA2_/TRDRNA2_82422_c1~~gnl/TRDRNA2_/TRDRNA2_82422_c1_seq1.p1  ORF type:complete len:354 (+),score=69.19 gnl/TRDRNA2_/TRDRNA2_82422_c1_seq1:59-1063(+)
MHGMATTVAHSRSEIDEILTTYLLIFRMGKDADFLNSRKIQILKRNAKARDPGWKELEEYELEAMSNFTHNSNSADVFTRQEAESIMLDLALRYGKWQNKECEAMKMTLMNLQGFADGSVDYATFHAAPQDRHYGYTFNEASSYLQRIGALQETESGSRVLISNYVTGPSNCIAMIPNTMVCCINECEAPLDEIERKLGAPTGQPDRILQIVANISTSTVRAPRQLSVELVQTLKEVAQEHKGTVKLRSASFANWLHEVLPNECPRPLSFEFDAEEETIADATEAILKRDATGAPLQKLLGDERCTRVPTYMTDDDDKSGDEMVIEEAPADDLV